MLVPKVQYGHFRFFILPSLKKYLKSFCFRPLFIQKSGEFFFFFFFLVAKLFLLVFSMLNVWNHIVFFFRIKKFFKLWINVLWLNSWAPFSVLKWWVKLMKNKNAFNRFVFFLFNYFRLIHRSQKYHQLRIKILGDCYYCKLRCSEWPVHIQMRIIQCVFYFWFIIRYIRSEYRACRPCCIVRSHGPVHGQSNQVNENHGYFINSMWTE